MNPQLPIVAIGGINTNNVAPVAKTSANGNFQSFQPFLKVKNIEELFDS